jgi:hypothetical protein
VDNASALPTTPQGHQQQRSIDVLLKSVNLTCYRQCSSAIPPFRGENFKHLAFVIDGTPQIVGLAVDADENLVKMPAPT